MTESLKCQKYFDQRIGSETVFVLPGHHFVQTERNVPVSTLLGSCVAACIRDTVSGIGGLNHFLLPEKANLADENQSSRYGVFAMEVLINDLLKTGAKKENLEAKIFGGGNVIQTSAMETVGAQNGNFVRNFLNIEGIPLLSDDIGGDYPRRIYFFPETGRVSVLRITSSHQEQIKQSELEMRKTVQAKQSNGGVELF